jgi:hypothetical protein
LEKSATNHDLNQEHYPPKAPHNQRNKENNTGYDPKHRE